MLVEVQGQCCVHTENDKATSDGEDLLPLLALQIWQKQEGGEEATEEAAHMGPGRAPARGSHGTHNKIHQECQHQQSAQQRPETRTVLVEGVSTVIWKCNMAAKVFFSLEHEFQVVGSK